MIKYLIPVIGYSCLILAQPAAAETKWEHGKRLVEINCTKCHSVGENGESPLTDAPPFREVALNYDIADLVDGFMEGLAVRHPSMPEWQMTEPQAEAIATYILSLKSAATHPTTIPPDANVTAGEMLLAANCSGCHAIGLTGRSANRKAPPFRDVARRYDPSNLEEALAEGIVTGHNEMPEFVFAPEQITQIIAYLNSLKPGG
jgi:mono/diheme cytochrome c family protein